MRAPRERIATTKKDLKSNYPATKRGGWKERS
jgi:hypothetical protein